MKKNNTWFTNTMKMGALCLLISTSMAYRYYANGRFSNALIAKKNALLSKNNKKEKVYMSNDKMNDLIQRIKADTEARQQKMKQSGSQLIPNLKNLDAWANKDKERKVSPPLPKSPIELPKAMNPETQEQLKPEDWNAMEMRAKIALAGIHDQVIELQTSLLVESPFYEYLESEFQALTEAINDINSILKLEVDASKMSEQGIHEYEPFLKKREQLLRKFKK